MLHFTRGPQFEWCGSLVTAAKPHWCRGGKAISPTLSLSPDGSRLVIALNTGGRTEVWMKNTSGRAFARLVTG
jgi:Tol biopolymer transport system component